MIVKQSQYRTSLMKLNTRLTLPTFILGLIIVAIPFTANWNLPLLNGTVVRWIENGRALWLLFGALLLSATSGLYHVLKAKTILALGGCVVVGVAGSQVPVGAVIISPSTLNFCSELSQWY